MVLLAILTERSKNQKVVDTLEKILEKYEDENAA